MASPRIISGKVKGFRLKSVPGDTTRPITDRVKEALFNIISGDIVDSSFLDLFGGTGSVGIEALSRGAAHVTFFEKNTLALKILKENISKCGFSSLSQVIKGDAFYLISQQNINNFDYVFIAPPQYLGLWSKMMSKVDSLPNKLSDNAWIIVQINPKEYSHIQLLNLEEFDIRDYGSTRLVFYRKIN